MNWTQRRFDKYAMSLWEAARNVSNDAGQEYSREENAFEHFDDAAQALSRNEHLAEITPVDVALVFLNKHIRSIMSGVSNREEMEGRIIDAINYLVIVGGLRERESEQRRENQEEDADSYDPDSPWAWQRGDGKKYESEHVPLTDSADAQEASRHPLLDTPCAPHSPTYAPATPVGPRWPTLLRPVMTPRSSSLTFPVELPTPTFTDAEIAQVGVGDQEPVRSPMMPFPDRHQALKPREVVALIKETVNDCCEKVAHAAVYATLNESLDSLTNQSENHLT